MEIKAASRVQTWKKIFFQVIGKFGYSVIKNVIIYTNAPIIYGNQII